MICDLVATLPNPSFERTSHEEPHEGAQFKRYAEFDLPRVSSYAPY